MYRIVEDLQTPVVPFDELRYDPETRSYHHPAAEAIAGPRGEPAGRQGATRA